MKTTLRDLSEAYASLIADQTILAGKPIVPEDICHAFCDGYETYLKASILHGQSYALVYLKDEEICIEFDQSKIGKIIEVKNENK
jgi:hypothetical protein